MDISKFLVEYDNTLIEDTGEEQIHYNVILNNLRFKLHISRFNGDTYFPLQYKTTTTIKNMSYTAEVCSVFCRLFEVRIKGYRKV